MIFSKVRSLDLHCNNIKEIIKELEEAAYSSYEAKEIIEEIQRLVMKLSNEIDKIDQEK